MKALPNSNKVNNRGVIVDHKFKFDSQNGFGFHQAMVKLVRRTLQGNDHLYISGKNLL